RFLAFFQYTPCNLHVTFGQYIVPILSPSRKLTPSRKRTFFQEGYTFRTFQETHSFLEGRTVTYPPPEAGNKPETIDERSHFASH
ncbi:MAG: hypothetical protein KC418_07535, partial [Anaerolineales bacterium]|nr:hypothetical protein [Anaerolineales bacterium]